MATPTYPSRRYYACGAVQAAAWGTALPVGALNELNVTSDGNPALKQTYSSCDAIDRVMPLDGDLGAYEAIDFSPEFAGKCGLQYSPGEMGSLIGALFGTLVAPAAQGGTAAYKHIFTWADAVTDFFTFVTERPGDIWEIPSCVPNKLSLKVGDGKLQGSISLRGNMLNNNSAVNTATQVDALTPETSGNFVKFQHGVLLMNDQADGALAAPTDTLITSDLELTFERTMDAQLSMGATYVAQPTESMFKISVKIKFPYITAANTWLDMFTTMAPQKMSITFQGALAAVAYPYEVQFNFPRLKLIAPPDIKLEDIISGGLEFVAEEAAAAPTGMAYVRPYMSLTNLRSTAYVT
jgi:hypothetical protein